MGFEDGLDDGEVDLQTSDPEASDKGRAGQKGSVEGGRVVSEADELPTHGSRGRKGTEPSGRGL